MTILTSSPIKALRGAFALSLCTVLPAALASSVPAHAATSELDQAVSALRDIGTMTADFTQTDRNGQTVSGKLYLKRPGKIRFEYEKGANMLLVSTGKSLYFIDYEVKQVQRWPIKNSPLGALLDPNRDVKAFGKLVPTSNANVVGIEVRDPKRPEYGVITLIFVRDASAPGGLELTNWVALDAQNHRTTVRLSNQRYGMAISDKEFTFVDPRRSGGRPR
ncbi:outer membrane lipoprotein carrier protein LolA [Porphyrobacter algicida]|uniref:Outer membrane lipoprotein carrier protein LolA n=1 Tax=Qipengyuania algicida TaxID=1836209 RepID=A0A845ALC5_9SPHN|nr:outer membrane lipoprotein carrier protein LolA [Qipengyuania algicida]MXP29336.1 outer membrane lipoprotein carrier protein LolA [Qipengyuania algicida]